MRNTSTSLQSPSVSTMYFIGVTTAQSSMMKIFPRWSELLNLEAELVGIDLPLNAPRENYRTVVENIRNEPFVKGALVTTHKIDLLESARDLFGELDSYARLCGEVSCIAKQDHCLTGYAIDPISFGLAYRSFMPQDHWKKTNGHVLCFGAGGSGVAMSVYLATATDRPRKLILVDLDQQRLDKARTTHEQLKTDIEFEYICNEDPAKNDKLMAALPAGSLAINATGMGKDRPGSPITDQSLFPQNGFAWEFNYRGELKFLRQAQAQAQTRNLRVEDGWIYFLHGWSQVIAKIFSIDLRPEIFNRLDETAAFIRG